jgi:hypothetical protein
MIRKHPRSGHSIISRVVDVALSIPTPFILANLEQAFILRSPAPITAWIIV